MNKCIKLLIIIFTVIGLASFFFIVFNKVYFNTSGEIDSDLASQFGEFLGGYVGTIFSVLSVFLLIYSINRQNTETKKADIRNNFFKMLDYHNENVKQLRISHIDTNKEDDKSEGRRAFVIFKIQIHRLISLVKGINDDNKYNLTEREVANIAYLIFYYGIDKEWMEFITEKLSNYPKNIPQQILEKIEANPKFKLERTNQTSLSSYFRNMYNSIKLVDDDKYLSPDEKQALITIYRAQLSNPELYVLFFNVISPFGKKWIEKKYIVNYQFVRNIPKDYCDGFDVKEYFPMTYEYEDIS